jgi:hypothetical protein
MEIILRNTTDAVEKESVFYDGTTDSHESQGGLISVLNSLLWEEFNGTS